MISYKREGSVLHTKSFSFAVRIVKLFKYLSDKDYKMGAIFNQLLRSGTSISANVHESEFAQSSSDFASKLHISLKEANETMNWLNSFWRQNTSRKKNLTVSQMIAMS